MILVVLDQKRLEHAVETMKWISHLECPARLMHAAVDSVVQNIRMRDVVKRVFCKFSSQYYRYHGIYLYSQEELSGNSRFAPTVRFWLEMRVIS